MNAKIFLSVATTVAACTMSASTMSAQADVTLPPQFSEGMVLQQKMAVPIWGMAAPGEKVSVGINGQNATATAGADGKWMVKLKPLQAGGPFVLTVAGKNTVTIQNVLVGEVWLCSGQSNMEFTVDRVIDAEKEIAAANDPMIRMFTVETGAADTPQAEVKGQWKSVAPDTVAKMSAVAYFFARELRKTMKVPFGLINSSAGWTPAEAWTSREAMLANPELAAPIVGKWDGWFAQYPKAKAMYDEKMVAWQKEADAAKAAGKDAPPALKAPGDPHFIHQASGMYNGKIAPLIGYGIRGVLWYQGETNIERAYQYRTLFPTLIKDWRTRWGQGDFPVLFVQLAAVGDAPEQPMDNKWSELREAQLMTEKSVPNTGMVVAIDVNHDPKDVHPKNKQEIARRLALAARRLVYGEKTVNYSGPRSSKMKVEGNAIRLSFTGTAGGLKTGDGAAPTGFQIAGADKKWFWADAKIDGDTILVSSPQVMAPVAVRYGWKEFPTVNLIGSDGLPASTFRTDDWDGMTKGYTGMFYTQIGMDDVTMTTP